MAFEFPTPTKTPAETLANGVAIGGRLSVALEEAKRRLKTELPPLIQYINQERGLVNTRAIQPFKDVKIAPADLTQKHINTLLVGGGVRIEAQGSRGFRSVGVMSLYLINERWSMEEQYLSALDRAGVVRLLLHNYLSFTFDPQGRKVWHELVPMNEEPLPEKWKEYAGISLPYQVVQAAGDNPWAV